MFGLFINSEFNILVDKDKEMLNNWLLHTFDSFLTQKIRF